MTKPTEIKAFKMLLNYGQKDEYKKRHDEMWPSLSSLLKTYGAVSYHIYFDEDTHTLFAHLEHKSNMNFEALAKEEIMIKWWHYMQDIMQTEKNHQPIEIGLQPLFAL